MSQSRGAVAPTSGSQDQVAVMESTLDQAVADAAKNAEASAATTPRERPELLARVVRDTYAVADSRVVRHQRQCGRGDAQITGPSGGTFVGQVARADGGPQGLRL